MALTVPMPRANALKTTNGFWWANLSTSDDAAAAGFYADLLGWSYDEMPLSDGMVHRNAKLGDALIAGIDPLMPGGEWPTAWTNYVFVDDASATCARAVELGATVVMEPMDVMGEGHIAMLMAPDGAAVGLWQPGRHTGADAVNQPGTYTWVELASGDLDAAKSFYADLFGWSWSKMDGDGPMEYWLAELGGRQFAGAYAKLPEMGDMPSNWAPYFGVADITAAADQITSGGGSIVMGPAQMGPGKGVLARDPQGAFFFALQLDAWPED